MATGIYNAGLLKLCDRTIDWANASTDIRIALVKSGFTFDKTHTALSTALGANECDATAYVRKTTASRTIAANSSSNPVTWRVPDVTWTALGGASNNTLDGAIVYLYNVSDASAVPLFYLDPSNLVTNGSDVLLDMDGSAGVGGLTN